MPVSCPPDELLSQLLVEQLPAPTEEELDEHLRGCGVCQERLERLSAGPVPTASLPARAALPADFARRLEDSLNDLISGNDLDESPPKIPGYELYEVIGRGGTSIVYRAREATLKRTVAIKVLREKASRVAKERFAREARALATLHHPNIVRVIEVGEATGHVFLVLEYVAGQSLGRFAAGEPQPAPAAARLVRQLADAMAAAHAAGLVHRDLKPANVLLEPSFNATDGSGLDRFIPRVTDFGIVKDLNEDAGLTRTRDCLGTPSYMAPEQVQGSATGVDGRTDVYALGAILYELLTGRPPFRAGTPLDTMFQVKHEEPVTPTRFQPRIPRDLENICLKCLEKAPAQRYPSTHALADDLVRYLQGKSVQARPVPWYGRTWRWCRRYPGWATAAALSLAVLLALAIGGPIVAQREATLRAEAEAHERQAAAERTRAREHLELASQALERTLEQALRSARMADSALDDVRAALIRGSVPYLEQFVQLEEEDRDLKFRQCRTLLQLAILQTKEKELNKAEACYQRALSLLQKLGADLPQAVPDEVSTLSSAHMEYGRFLHVNRRDNARAEEHYRAALGLSERLLRADANSPRLRDQVAIQTSLLGNVLMDDVKRKEESQQLHQRAVELRDQLVADLPERNDLRHYAALVHMNLGMFHRKYNNFADEIREMKRAWDLEKPLLDLDSTWPETPFTLAMLEGDLGIAYLRAGRKMEGLLHVHAALKMAQALTLAFPREPRFQELQKRLKEVLKYVEKQP